MESSDPERTSYHHGNLRQELLSLALAALEESGAEALSLRDLASRLGVSKAAPYRHFPDKAALLQALMKTGWSELRRALIEASAHLPPLQGLQAMGQAYLRFAQERAHLYRLLFSGMGKAFCLAMPPDPQVDPFTPLLEQVRLCQGDGWKADREPRMLALSIWAHVHGLAELSLEGLVAPPEGTPPLAFWTELLRSAL